jgi:hypothetical protein
MSGDAVLTTTSTYLNFGDPVRSAALRRSKGLIRDDFQRVFRAAFQAHASLPL